ncbi:hypothetical protein AB7849_14975 [Rhodanobacter sp. 115]|uniref:hypothetical protein n=1 Tax=Rhodanobacter sp. FW021-MT20 TaxID=1162282 RepID=UPI0012F86A9B|nr:hypothetical protein [Rhodanobacter sp. 115]
MFDEQTAEVIAAEGTAKVMMTIGREGRMRGMKIGDAMGLATWAAFGARAAL